MACNLRVASCVLSGRNAHNLWDLWTTRWVTKWCDRNLVNGRLVVTVAAPDCHSRTTISWTAHKSLMIKWFESFVWSFFLVQSDVLIREMLDNDNRFLDEALSKQQTNVSQEASSVASKVLSIMHWMFIEDLRWRSSRVGPELLILVDYPWVWNQTLEGQGNSFCVKRCQTCPYEFGHRWPRISSW